MWRSNDHLLYCNNVQLWIYFIIIFFSPFSFFCLEVLWGLVMRPVNSTTVCVAEAAPQNKSSPRHQSSRFMRTALHRALYGLLDHRSSEEAQQKQDAAKLSSSPSPPLSSLCIALSHMSHASHLDLSGLYFAGESSSLYRQAYYSTTQPFFFGHGIL
jgi:hypothetical protein